MDLQERTRWSEEVPVLPSWKPGEGRKRERSSSQSKAGVEKERSNHLRGIARVVPIGVAVPAQSASQPDPGVPGARSGFVDQDDGHHQEEEMEDVVILNEDDLEGEQADPILSSSKPMDL